ncbi:MFS transporter [Rhodobacter ferrooxidans]|uniref:MFS transporter n=1 Tax=Rhodobacter ferrooxidans TaxID=371731 RepID=UPI001E53FD3D|nr:MFS transporter [Rhodobacter sp. SW2]
MATRGRWAVAAMFLTNGFIMGSWAPQIPLLLPRHQISEFTLGLLILGLGLGAVAAMAVSGGLIARHGSRPVLRGFAIAASGTLLAVVLAPNLWLLAATMAVMGALIGCMDVAMNANAVEVERRLGRAIMSSSHGFWSLGGFVGGGVGGWIIASQGAVVHAALVSGLALALVLAVGPRLDGAPPVPRVAGTAGQKHRHWPRSFTIYLIGLMALASMVPEGAVLDWAALYLARDLGSSVSTSGLAFAAFAGSMALMRFAGDGLRNRFGAVVTLRVSGAVAAAGLLGAAFAPLAPLAIGCFAIAGLGIANMVPITLSAAGNLPGLGAGVGISIVTMMGYSGILVAPASIGFVAEHIGYRVTYATLALLLVGVALLARQVAAADDRQVH